MHQHNFKLSEKRIGYELCECGTYHSIMQGDPEVLYKENDYWTHEENRSLPEEQIGNLTSIEECGISKIDRVLQFVPDGESVLEIACFPGTLLNKLSERGYKWVYGIEPNSKWIEFICQQAPKAAIIEGFFPQVFNPKVKEIYDCIIGMDIMEHVDDYEGFFDAVHRLLKTGATAIFMSPIILEDGFIRERDFKPDEHAWLFSKKFLEEYLKDKFSEVRFARWIVSHEILILKK